MDRIAAPAIECRDLWFQYNGHYILENIALTIAPGDFVAVIGPNGGGKTTLLKLILGLLKPSRGQVSVMGSPPAVSSHLIGYVPQGARSGPHFPVSVLDVVLMGTLMPGIRRHTPTRRQRTMAIEALDMMEASHLTRRRIGDLSGGQRRRVFIARALVTRPQILLLDEPMAGIDPQGQNKLYCLLESINAGTVKTTIMLVSHDLMAISTHVKSVACVNRRLHFHDGAEITPDMLDDMYPGIGKAACPVELVAHGVPHRVLRSHEGNEDV